MATRKNQDASIKKAQILLGENIRSRRQSLQLSQEELGLRINADQAYISRLERGLFNPTLESMTEIAQALDIEIYQLLVRSKT